MLQASSRTYTSAMLGSAVINAELRAQLTVRTGLQVTDKGAMDVIDEVEAAVCEAVITVIDGVRCQPGSSSLCRP